MFHRVHACVRACMRACMRVHRERICMRACVHACMHACVCVCMEREYACECVCVERYRESVCAGGMREGMREEWRERVREAEREGRERGRHSERENVVPLSASCFSLQSLLCTDVLSLGTVHAEQEDVSDVARQPHDVRSHLRVSCDTPEDNHSYDDTTIYQQLETLPRSLL